MNLKDVIGNGVMTGLSGALLWHFSNIWRYGQHLIQEPNIIILCLETVGLLVIFIFGISNYISGSKEKPAKKIKNESDTAFYPTHKPALTKRIGDNMTALNGWEHVGYYDSCLIYKKDNKKRLVDPKTGQSTFEYTVVLSDSGRSVINGKEFVSDEGKGDKNARL